MLPNQSTPGRTGESSESEAPDLVAQGAATDAAREDGQSGSDSSSETKGFAGPAARTATPAGGDRSDEPEPLSTAQPDPGSKPEFQFGEGSATPDDENTSAADGGSASEIDAVLRNNAGDATSDATSPSEATDGTVPESVGAAHGAADDAATSSTDGDVDEDVTTSSTDGDDPVDDGSADSAAPDSAAPDSQLQDGAHGQAGPEQSGSGGIPAPTTPSVGERAAAADVPSSEDMAPPLPEIVGDGPRDEVWGQDRPEPEGTKVAALSQLIESVTMSAPGEKEQLSRVAEEVVPARAESGAAQDAPPQAGPGTEQTGGPENADPDQMEEAPTDRPVPADAIRRASEALDAAVNAAPAVIGSASRPPEEEAGSLVDAELAHFAGETESESEPDGAASDYSSRVTDPIPVQGLSAPGVSRETAGPVQMPHGTQQPTGGPHGGDDERRSALIATVPAVDDTTPVAAELAMDARRRIELQGRRFPRPPKTRIITVANQKGGVGKTTTTVNVAAGLAQSGLNVLVIDNDPQGNASTALGIEHRAGTPSVYEVLVEGESLASTVQPCPDVPNLWGVPATIDLSGSEIELVSLVSRETRLRKAIDKYLADRVAAGEERIDYVLIDCPPSLGLLTVNAFVAGREVFIPIQCEYYALEGLSQLLKTIDLIRSHLNPELRVSSILLTMYDGRTNLAQQVAGEVRSHFPAETFKTTIPRSVRISEAPSYGQTVMTYDATSTGALAYLQASRELAERGQGGSSPRRALQAEPVGAQD